MRHLAAASGTSTAQGTRPFVSVVIPARNVATTLRLQLASLALQDLDEPWEIVVAENQSTDDTPGVIEEWSARLPQVRSVTVEGIGANRARNGGVDVARADRILCCDADDEVAAGW